MAKTSMVPPDAQKLRDVFRARYEETDLPALLTDIQRGPDRTICIILSAMIERDLEHLILTRIAIGTDILQKHQKKLFNQDGPLATFDRNTRLARALKLINDITEKELIAIREIRNRFAHTALPLNFESPEIKTRLRNIRRAGYYMIIFDETELIKISEHRREFVLSCLQVLTDIAASLIVVQEFIASISGIEKPVTWS